MFEKNISDVALISFIRHDKKAGYDLLYKRYAPLLYGCISRIIKKEDIATDILLKSFIEIWKKVDVYDAKEGSLFIWMMNITRVCLCAEASSNNYLGIADCELFELIFYKITTYGPSTLPAGRPQSEIKKDLRKSLQTVKKDV